MKLLIIGHARHGKDTVAQMIHKHTGMKFKSSSEAAAEIFIYDELKERYGYETPYECFEDRVHRRKEWHEMICDFNKDDKARLAKEILKEADIYVGMRSYEEIQECLRQGLFDLVIGVFDPNKPEEHSSSFDIDIWEDADFVIPNTQGLKELNERVIKIMDKITQK